MKSYRFRLATVARIRAVEERVARDRYMVTLRERRQAEDVLRTQKLALLNLEAPRGVLSIDDVEWSADQAQRMSRSVLAAYEIWSVVSTRCENERRAWSEASQRSEILERLDDSGREVWREESQRQESLELDDLTNSRFLVKESR